MRVATTLNCVFCGFQSPVQRRRGAVFFPVTMLLSNAIFLTFFYRTATQKMYSSVYGPSASGAAGMRGYRGSDMISNGGSNGYHPHQYRGSVASNSVDLGGQSRRYPRSDFPPTRYRPPLPTYTMQSVSRSSSYGSSANHNKSSTNEVPRSGFNFY